MRALPWVLVAAALGCRPSATVEHTMPVANLQSYKSVALAVKSSAFATQGLAMFLEQATAAKLKARCGFEQIVPASSGVHADVVLDLNILSTARGGGSWVSNSNVVTIETLLVLSDGQTNDPLGTARIRGKSGGMIMNNQAPENEAIDVIATTVADVLAKSGCTGPRVARVEPPPAPTPGPGSASPTNGSNALPEDKQRGEAEALNESGKEKLRSADLAGALADFVRAVSLVPDARYQYNVCLTLEAQEKFDTAISACKQAKAMNPEPRLMTKVDHRIELLANHQ